MIEAKKEFWAVGTWMRTRMSVWVVSVCMRVCVYARIVYHLVLFGHR